MFLHYKYFVSKKALTAFNKQGSSLKLKLNPDPDFTHAVLKYDRCFNKHGTLLCGY